MLSRKDNSNFGWDEHRQLVVAKDVSLIMTNLLPSTQKLKPLGKVLKQPLLLFKK
ncbi:hypothetical protein Godav_023127 [Gossypium davidsonii]|uniref:Myb/SANT-like domain-containing protein n=1 Tax=Gossypium davidsonii TaxID=34287 RepID=A0A7J8SQI2_GOSDV|nr:hypothetical protein [Gossypium davidsonii]